MSLSAYDIFMRMDGGYDDEESSTASSNVTPLPSSTTIIMTMDEEDDHQQLPSSSVSGSDSFVSMSADAISLDSAVLQELENSNIPRSIGDGERTIVSSAPSGATIPPPEASQDIFALTPHPQFVADAGIHSLSTTSTDCLPFENLLRGNRYDYDDNNSTMYDHDDVDEDDDDDSLISMSTTENSLSNRAMVLRRAGPVVNVRNREGRHEAIVFERIASQLIGEAAQATQHHGHWYSRLISESDWDQFRVTAQAILSTLEPRPSTALIPIPPQPPMLRSTALNNNDGCGRQVMYCAEDHLPFDFICGLCKDVIVGAVALDCGCSNSTVCAPCWESDDCPDRASPSGRYQDVSDQMGFVWIERSSRKCPSCQTTVNTKLHCHALDVAILQIIRDTTENYDDDDNNNNNSTTIAKIECLKQNYYSRLAAWRATVYDRNETRTKQRTAEHDEVLARWIQAEEEIFWNPRDENHDLSASLSAKNGIFFLGQAAVALVAATIASIGLSAISSRR
jgi:hypothetical protein